MTFVLAFEGTHFNIKRSSIRYPARLPLLVGEEDTDKNNAVNLDKGPLHLLNLPNEIRDIIFDMTTATITALMSPRFALRCNTDHRGLFFTSKQVAAEALRSVYRSAMFDLGFLGVMSDQSVLARHVAERIHNLSVYPVCLPTITSEFHENWFQTERMQNVKHIQLELQRGVVFSTWDRNAIPGYRRWTKDCVWLTMSNDVLELLKHVRQRKITMHFKYMQGSSVDFEARLSEGVLHVEDTVNVYSTEARRYHLSAWIASIRERLQPLEVRLSTASQEMLNAENATTENGSTATTGLV